LKYIQKQEHQASTSFKQTTKGYRATTHELRTVYRATCIV